MDSEKPMHAWLIEREGRRGIRDIVLDAFGEYGHTAQPFDSFDEAQEAVGNEKIKRPDAIIVGPTEVRGRLRLAAKRTRALMDQTGATRAAFLLNQFEPPEPQEGINYLMTPPPKLSDYLLAIGFPFED